MQPDEEIERVANRLVDDEFFASLRRFEDYHIIRIFPIEKTNLFGEDYEYEKMWGVGPPPNDGIKLHVVLKGSQYSAKLYNYRSPEIVKLILEEEGYTEGEVRKELTNMIDKRMKEIEERQSNLYKSLNDLREVWEIL